MIHSRPFQRAAIAVAVAVYATLSVAVAQTAPKPATPTTASANREFAKVVSQFDKRDLEDATRGLIATFPDPQIKTPDGKVVWDAGRFGFIKDDAPDTVNPSLWRMEKLSNVAGLFKVTDGIYQIRSHDLANMTLVEGKTGWIVIDTLLTAEAAKATLAFAMDKLGSNKPVVAVIYTHSHIDHFGGVRGVVNEADVVAGKVKVIAPEGFMEHAIAENVLAGNAMTRRATYQFGNGLDFNDKQGVGSGLGKALSNGVMGLIPPNTYATKTGEEMTVDGVRIVFQMAHNSEAPSEMMFYFPDKKVL